MSDTGRQKGATMRVRLKALNPFSFLFVSSKDEQYLAQYVVREHGRGRPLAEILADSYVRNRSTSEQRARILERPEVVEAIGERTIADMRHTLERNEPVVAARG